MPRWRKAADFGPFRQRTANSCRVPPGLSKFFTVGIKLSVNPGRRNAQPIAFMGRLLTRNESCYLGLAR